MVCCAAANCSSRTEQGLRAFRLPKDPKRRAVWIQNMQRGDDWKPTDHSRLCEVCMLLHLPGTE